MTKIPGEPDHVTRLRNLEERIYRLEHTGGSGAPNLRDLADTNVAKAANGQTLAYDQPSGLWKALPPSELEGVGGGGAAQPYAIAAVAGVTSADDYEVEYANVGGGLRPLTFHPHPRTIAVPPFTITDPAGSTPHRIELAANSPGVYHVGVNLYLYGNAGEAGYLSLWCSLDSSFPIIDEYLYFSPQTKQQVSISTLVEVVDRPFITYFEAGIKNLGASSWYSYPYTRDSVWIYRVADSALPVIAV